MLGINPKGREGLKRVEHITSPYMSLGQRDMNIFWRAVEEEGQGEGGDNDKDAQDNIAEDDTSQSDGPRDDTSRPEPIWVTLFVLILVGVPL